MMFRKSTALVIASTHVFAANVSGQQNAQPAQPGQPARPGVQVQVNPSQGAVQHPMVTEQSLAACLAIANQEEVAIAQFVSEKTKNDDVKEFTKMLIDDHQAFLKKLQRFTPEARNSTLQQTASTESGVQQAGGANQAVNAQTTARTQAQGGANPQQQPAAQAQPQRQGQPIQQTAGQAQSRQPIDLVQLHREIAQQCLTDAKKNMEEKEGAKFDACFIGHQIASHEAMKTKLTVFQRHASGEFAQLLSEGIKSTEKHLKDAEKIMDDLADVKDSKK
jgi:predicted outer membrane protein